MADKALRLKMERGQCMDLFPVPASAVAQALAPFGLEERDALSDLLPEGTFYSPLGPSDVQSGDQGDAASYTLGKKLKKSQYVARAPDLLRMLFQPWFSQEALDRLAAGAVRTGYWLRRSWGRCVFPSHGPRPDWTGAGWSTGWCGRRTRI